MIPVAMITEWRSFAPWAESFQVEQDLVLTKALVQIYSDSHLKNAFAFRGGTALQKIFFPSPTRYSEDIDLVQVRTEPIGESVNALRAILDPWLGEPRVDRGSARFTLKYRFLSQETQIPLRLKIEINTGEHFTVLGHKKTTFEMQNSWFTGQCEILSFEVEEILSTKLRALYQRKKGRDLFDMSMAFQHFKSLDDKKMIACFQKYMEHGGTSVSRAEYEANLFHKLNDNVFLEDIQPLLRPGTPKFDVRKEGEYLKNRTLSLLPGAPWKAASERKN
ncbi:MAG: nucleotidyl transferase AbiEii/AbiGii toxin family protein [Pseudobdellovibrionaceae bacterium]